jgi:hypothetical protein
MEKFTKRFESRAVLPLNDAKISYGGVTGEPIERLADYETLLEKEPFEVKAELYGLRVEHEKFKACYEVAYHTLMKASLIIADI